MTVHDDANPGQSEAQEPSLDEALADFLGLIDETVTNRLTPDEIARRREQLKASRKTGANNPPATSHQAGGAPPLVPMPAPVSGSEWPTAAAITAAARREARKIRATAHQTAEEYQDAALKRAAETVAAARREAERILAAARQEAHAVITAASDKAERTLEVAARQHAWLIAQAAHIASPQQLRPTKVVGADTLSELGPVWWLNPPLDVDHLSPVTFPGAEGLQPAGTYRREKVKVPDHPLVLPNDLKKFLGDCLSHQSDLYSHYLTGGAFQQELGVQRPGRAGRASRGYFREHIYSKYDGRLGWPGLGSAVQTSRRGSLRDHLLAWCPGALPFDVDGFDAAALASNWGCLETTRFMAGTDVPRKEMLAWLTQLVGAGPVDTACQSGDFLRLLVVYFAGSAALPGAGLRVRGSVSASFDSSAHWASTDERLVLGSSQPPGKR